MTQRWAFATVGLAAGFSGLAVITTILTGLPLLLAEAALVLVPLAVVIILARRTPRPIVLDIWRVVRAGLLAGSGATIVYAATPRQASCRVAMMRGWARRSAWPAGPWPRLARG